MCAPFPGRRRKTSVGSQPQPGGTEPANREIETLKAQMAEMQARLNAIGKQ